MNRLLKTFLAAALLVSPAVGRANPLANRPTDPPRPPATLHAPSTMPVHPAVVRICVAEKTGQSVGSGTLVDVRDQFGLVITNWHVVREATGEISVAFPDGFRSAARVVKFDADWDLAALSIWRPAVSPVRISNEAPQPREPLTIAGYGGDGLFRAVTGPCTQYLAPSDKHPHEIVELAVLARQGDSGGPIFNQRGELAGVLFGSDRTTTSGSYGGRVLKFLEPLLNGQNPFEGPPLGAPGSPAGIVNQQLVTTVPIQTLDGQMQGSPLPNAPARTAAPLEPVVSDALPAEDAELQIVHTPFGSKPIAAAASESDPTARLVQDLIGRTPIEQAKAALAIVGLCTLGMFALRASKSAPPAEG